MATKNTLFTPVNIPEQKHKINCDTSLMTIGSCFSDHIGNLLAHHKFNCTVNPFGTLFNPISICKSLERAIQLDLVQKEEIHSDGNRHFHFDYHSVFNRTSAEEVVKAINGKINSIHAKINTLEYVLITFGTSIIYERNDTKSIVSNCHKVVADRFTKRMLSIQEMTDRVKKCISLLKSVNPEIKIILTVSPVRHSKEGLVQNSLSKARLVDLCHQLANLFTGISYFPSFEIMMDELRDYRYYKRDLIHPTELAIDVIWNRFKDVHFSKKANQKVVDIAKLIAAKNHRPFDESTSDFEKFRKQQIAKILLLQKTYPTVDFDSFLDHFNA